MGKGYYLCVGVNAPSPKHYGYAYETLLGSQNDAVEMQKLAKAVGFGPLSPQAPILIGGDAMYAAVQRCLETVPSTITPDDFLLLTFSGHGGRYTRNDLGNLKEAQAETWCLFDSELFDLELGQLWSTVAPGARILVVSDSCNSGTMISFPPPRTSTAHNPKRTIKSLTATSKAAAQASGRMDYERRLKDILRREEATRRTKASVLLLAACQETGDALDADEGTSYPLALFSENLLKVWSSGSYEGTYYDFLDKVKNQVVRIEPDQTPKLFPLRTADRKFASQRPFTL